MIYTFTYVGSYEKLYTYFLRVFNKLITLTIFDYRLDNCQNIFSTKQQLKTEPNKKLCQVIHRKNLSIQMMFYSSVYKNIMFTNVGYSYRISVP